MFARRTVAAVALIAIVAGCSSGTGDTKQVAGPVSTTSSTVGASSASGRTTPEAATDTSVVAGIIVARIGEAVRTKDGNVVTVHSLEYPLDVAHPDPTKIYAAADIEGCAGATTHDAGVAAGFFRIELRDRTAWPPIQPVKEPALQPTKLAPNRCARGWVSFSLPKTIKPLLVALRSSTDAAWLVQ